MWDDLEPSPNRREPPPIVRQGPPKRRDLSPDVRRLPPEAPCALTERSADFTEPSCDPTEGSAAFTEPAGGPTGRPVAATEPTWAFTGRSATATEPAWPATEPSVATPFPSEGRHGGKPIPHVVPVETAEPRPLGAPASRRPHVSPVYGGADLAVAPGEPAAPHATELNPPLGGAPLEGPANSCGQLVRLKRPLKWQG
jgi:hypothetical protein